MHGWHTVYSRNQRRAEMWKLIQDYKQARGCSNCGYKEYPQALQFDHLRDKKANVSDLIRSDYSLETIMKEIEKCQILCANCHAVITHLRKSNPDASSSNQQDHEVQQSQQPMQHSVQSTSHSERATLSMKPLNLYFGL